MKTVRYLGKTLQYEVNGDDRFWKNKLDFPTSSDVSSDKKIGYR